MTKRRRLLAHGLIGVPMAILAAAGVIKFTDLTTFARDLDCWNAIPAALVAPVALVIPALEVGTAVLWFSGTLRALALVCGIALITIFSAMFAYELTAHGPPARACFGAVLRYEATRTEAWSVLIRNAGLLSAFSTGAWLWFGGTSTAIVGMETTPAAE